MLVSTSSSSPEKEKQPSEGETALDLYLASMWSSMDTSPSSPLFSTLTADTLPGYYSTFTFPIFTPTYSRKLFVGGLLPDVEKEHVRMIFSHYGALTMDWPKTASHPKERPGQRCSLNGYTFIVYEEEASVHRLLSDCATEDGEYFIFIASPTGRCKPAQVRPWLLNNAEYVAETPSYRDRRTKKIDQRKTVFIGGLGRTTTARDLCALLTGLFGQISYIGIDVDPELKYPKGSARVTFTTMSSFMDAIRAKFVRLSHSDTSKKDMEIKPYVTEGHPCDECEGKNCDGRSAPYFCSNICCLRYFCVSCWDTIHYGPNVPNERATHSPLVRLGDQTKALPIAPHLIPRTPLAYYTAF